MGKWASVPPPPPISKPCSPLPCPACHPIRRAMPARPPNVLQSCVCVGGRGAGVRGDHATAHCHPQGSWLTASFLIALGSALAALRALWFAAHRRGKASGMCAPVAGEDWNGRTPQEEGAGGTPYGPPPPPPPQTNVTIVGTSDIYHREILVAPFLVHKRLRFRTPPPPHNTQSFA